MSLLVNCLVNKVNVVALNMTWFRVTFKVRIKNTVKVRKNKMKRAHYFVRDLNDPSQSYMGLFIL